MYDEKSFAPMDKLLEFANGQTIPQQMIRSMNGIIENMRVPGAGNPMPEQAGEKSKSEGTSNES